MTERSKSCQLVMNKIETTILTPRGDVLVCRCRHSSTNFLNSGLPAGLEAEMVEPGFLCDTIQETSVCNACSTSQDEVYAYYKNGHGVLGGGLENQPITVGDGSSKEDVDDDFAKSVTSLNASLMAVPSFDYSCFTATTTTPNHASNRVSPGRLEQRNPLEVVSENSHPPEQHHALSDFGKLLNPFYESPEKSDEPVVVLTPSMPRLKPSDLMIPDILHGVPTSVRALNQIRITELSANPLGEHVLMISSEALLFSYGSNKYGQLGLGMKSPFVQNPAIVTLLLESGGKAVTCAAGVDHSLVVVKTEGQRIGRLRAKQHLKSPRIRGRAIPSRSPLNLSRVSSTPVRLDGAHEEGDTDSDECLVYHHQLYGFGRNDSTKLGLINPPINESVFVPRRVALHAKVWPNEKTEITFPPAGIFQVAASAHHSAALVKRATGDIELYTWGEAFHGALAVPLIDAGRGKGTSPMVVGSPSLIESLSFSSSGSFQQSVLDRNEFTKQVSLGPRSTFVTTSKGRCLSFGTSENGLLGTGKDRSLDPAIIHFPENDKVDSIDIGAKHALAKSSTGTVYTWGQPPLTHNIIAKPKAFSPISAVSAMCAGYDSSAFVTLTGTVLTCGERSGRLGQGEHVPDSKSPKQLLGGLRLWRNQTADL